MHVKQARRVVNETRHWGVAAEGLEEGRDLDVWKAERRPHLIRSPFADVLGARHTTIPVRPLSFHLPSSNCILPLSCILHRQPQIARLSATNFAQG